MENQHRKIAGYRELSQGEIDLMNEIKAFGPQLEQLCAKIGDHLVQQYKDAADAANQFDLPADAQEAPEFARLTNAEPGRWLNMGRADLQTGLMALTRAIAQPTFF